jgi:hypothetical protein
VVFIDLEFSGRYIYMKMFLILSQIAGKYEHSATTTHAIELIQHLRLNNKVIINYLTPNIYHTYHLKEPSPIGPPIIVVSVRSSSVSSVPLWFYSVNHPDDFKNFAAIIHNEGVFS